MDKISIAGLAIGLIAILGGQMLEGGHISSLAQPTAFLIVVGGTLGAVLLQSPLHLFKRGIAMAKWVWKPPVIDQKRSIDQILNWSQLSRREGLLALENFIPGLKDEFTRKGLQLLVDGADPERIRELLEVDISKAQQSSDWAAETLSQAQLEYAASDVLHLHALRDKLVHRLLRDDRMEHARACFEFLPTRAKLDLLGWEETDIFAHS